MLPEKVLKNNSSLLSVIILINGNGPNKTWPLFKARILSFLPEVLAVDVPVRVPRDGLGHDEREDASLALVVEAQKPVKQRHFVLAGCFCLIRWFALDSLFNSNSRRGKQSLVVCCFG